MSCDFHGNYHNQLNLALHAVQVLATMNQLDVIFIITGQAALVPDFVTVHLTSLVSRPGFPILHTDCATLIETLGERG